MASDMFEPITREKANGGRRLLICDRHCTYILATFVGHYMAHNVDLLLTISSFFTLDSASRCRHIQSLENGVISTSQSINMNWYCTIREM